MVQTSFNDPSARAGNSQNVRERRSIVNPRTVQVDNLDINSTTTDGTYTASLYDPSGTELLASVGYVAASKTAAQIAAGVVAAILADATWRGYISACAVVNTDQLDITYLMRRDSLAYVLRYTGPSGPAVSTTTSPGFTRVKPGWLLQWDGSGGYSTTYSDGSLAIGVVEMGSDVIQPDDPTVAASYGPAMINVVAEGEIDVDVVSGVTVSAGNKVYYNSTNKTWSNSSSGSHTLLKGAVWITGGTTVQRISVHCPAES